jgi:hypothetical protein
LRTIVALTTALSLTVYSGACGAAPIGDVRKMYSVPITAAGELRGCELDFDVATVDPSVSPPRNVFIEGSIFVVSVPNNHLGAGLKINTGRFTTAYVVGTLASTKLDVDVPYTVREEAIGSGFKYELLYQGFDRGVARVTYREYLADLARPAFQQDLTYTLSTSNDDRDALRE